MSNWLWVALGGAAGSVARYGVGVAALRWLGPGWPAGTLAVNIVGGLLMGVLIGWLAHQGGGDQERWRLFLGAGVLGGFTTFSAFTLEVVELFDRRGLASAGIYVGLSVALAIVALLAGLMLARRMFA